MILILVAAALAASILAPGIGPWAPLLPAFGLPAVLLAARRSPDGRYRWIALLTGILGGTLLDGALLAAPAALLLTGWCARATRRLLPVEGPAGLFATGTAWAAFEAALRFRLSGGAGFSSPGPAGFAALAGSVLIAGALFAAADLALDRLPALRHALERP